MQHNGSRRRESNTNSEFRSIPVHDGGAGFIVLSLREPQLLESTEGRQERFFQSTPKFSHCESTTVICDVDGDNKVNSVILHMPILWNVVVPRDNTTFALKS